MDLHGGINVQAGLVAAAAGTLQLLLVSYDWRYDPYKCAWLLSHKALREDKVMSSRVYTGTAVVSAFLLASLLLIVVF